MRAESCGSSHIRILSLPRTSRARPPVYPQCLEEYPSWGGVSYQVGFRNGGRRLPITTHTGRGARTLRIMAIMLIIVSRAPRARAPFRVVVTACATIMGIVLP